METFSTKKASFAEAKADCESRGGHLPRLNTLQEYLRFADDTRFNNKQLGVTRNYVWDYVYHWVDFNDVDDDGYWTHSDGSKPSYVKWGSDAVTGNCAAFDEGHDDVFPLANINLRSCDERLSYLCQDTQPPSVSPCPLLLRRTRRPRPPRRGRPAR